jgi:hypothetical protein
MKTTEVIAALRQAANVIEAEQDVIDGTHEYAQKYGGSPGGNVFRFLLEDATRMRIEIAAMRRGPEFYAYTPGAISDTRLEGMIDETRWWKMPGDEVYEVVRELREARDKLKRREGLMAVGWGNYDRDADLQRVHLEALRLVSAALGNPFKGDLTKTCLDLGLEVARRLAAQHQSGGANELVERLHHEVRAYILKVNHEDEAEAFVKVADVERMLRATADGGDEKLRILRVNELEAAALVSGKDLPLEMKVDGDVVRIAIGVDTLSWAAEASNEWNPLNEKTGEFNQTWWVMDKTEFAKDVLRALQREAEDGSSPFTRLLDQMTTAALDDGSLGVAECPENTPCHADRHAQEQLKRAGER